MLHVSSSVITNKQKKKLQIHCYFTCLPVSACTGMLMPLANLFLLNKENGPKIIAAVFLL